MKRAVHLQVIFTLSEEISMGRGVWESPQGNRLAFLPSGYWRVSIVKISMGRGVWESPLGNRLAFLPTGYWRVSNVEISMGRGVWESPLGNRLAFLPTGYWRVSIVEISMVGECGSHHWGTGWPSSLLDTGG